MPKILSIYNHYFRDFKINLNVSLGDVGIESHMIEHHYSNVGIADFGTDNFRQLTIEKISVIRTHLENFEKVLFLDNDIYLLKNPIPYFEEYLEDAEVLFQDDVNEFEYQGATYPVVNTGVIYIRKTEKTLALFDPCSSHVKEIGKRENDQDVLNRRLLDLNVDFKVLPREVFPCGKVWYTGGASESPYLVHYNWVAGKKAKIDKMKSYGHWKVAGVHTMLAYLYAKIQFELNKKRRSE